ncbi:hypothetical protein [uncultured Microbacterium sp.]|uniref:Uncharacterized protein n=1 Tax=uncultured Microbacterium sp. TaxID=191216 RepID=A0A1Y5P2N7_9MICO|nr:hypothetical protein [uncultured Microbacterium sp.]SBS72986.1 hypothetical protein MIPYR_30337 [uncultured Microbacterium sp.]
MDEWGLHGGVAPTLDAGGSIATSDGRRYRRSPERVKRSNGQGAVDAGASIATDIYPDGLYLFEGEAARRAWQAILPRLVVGKPPRVNDLQWRGHVWIDEDGSALLYLEGSH